MAGARRIDWRELWPFGVIASILTAACSVGATVISHICSATRDGVIGAVLALFCVGVVLVGSAVLGRELDELGRIRRGESPPGHEVRRQWTSVRRAAVGASPEAGDDSSPRRRETPVPTSRVAEPSWQDSKGVALTTFPPRTGVLDADLKRITAPVSPPPLIESTFIGEIRTINEYPTAETIEKLYDELDFQRACQAFLRNITASSMYSFREGLRRDLGATTPQHYVAWDGAFDANSVLLTPNSETVYGLAYLALDVDGPTVIEAPPGVLGVLNDMWMREVENIGAAGPDRGAGGSYLVLPPGYEGDVPDGYFIARSKTYGVWLALRAFRTPDGNRRPPWPRTSRSACTRWRARMRRRR